jgi:hypothetical protein
MRAYVLALLKDVLFWRVVMFLWGLPLAGFGFYVALAWQPTELGQWFAIALLAALGLLGAYFICVATFGSKARIERSMNYMHDGGDIVGIVVVMVVFVAALPIAAVLRALGRKPHA